MLQNDPPTVTQRIDTVEEIHYMERMTFALRTHEERGQEYWEKMFFVLQNDLIQR